MKLEFRVVEGDYSVHQLADLPSYEFLSSGTVFSLSFTSGEASFICPSDREVSALRSEHGWALIEVVGPFEFGVVGVIAQISGRLAEAGIPLMAFSTFSTDFVLVKADFLEDALKVLH